MYRNPVVSVSTVTAMETKESFLALPVI